MYYVTMRITFVTRKFGNVERNSHCDVLHITPVRVARLVLDCNGVFAIKAYCRCPEKYFKFGKKIPVVSKYLELHFFYAMNPKDQCYTVPISFPVDRSQLASLQPRTSEPQSEVI